MLGRGWGFWKSNKGGIEKIRLGNIDPVDLNLNWPEKKKLKTSTVVDCCHKLFISFRLIESHQVEVMRYHLRGRKWYYVVTQLIRSSTFLLHPSWLSYQPDIPLLPIFNYWISFLHFKSMRTTVLIRGKTWKK